MFDKIKRAKRVMAYVSKMKNNPDLIKSDIQIDIMKRIDDIRVAQAAGKLNHLYPDAIESYISDLKKFIDLYDNLDKSGQKTIIKHCKFLKERYDNLDKAISKAIGDGSG